MRIIAGKFGSRKINAVPGMNTRPTTDKVKEAIFSRIGPYFDGGVMLDLFAGSGSMSLEALSRGFDSCILVDKDYHAIKTIKENIQLLQVQDQCQVIKKEAMATLKELAIKQEKFDLVFLDPPYAAQKIAELLNLLCEYGCLNSRAYVICESDKEVELPESVQNLQRVKEATYGITKISYYRKED